MDKSKLIYLVVFLIVFLLTGCTQSSALPIEDKVGKIIIYTEDNKTKIKEYATPDGVKKIIGYLNKAEKTTFNDPERGGNFYQIVIQSGKKETTFIFNDMLHFGGKIYTEKSAEKGDVWEVTNEFGELLLGNERKSTLDN